LEVKWLEDFLALAGTLNFSKAADERNVTQSAFSRVFGSWKAGSAPALSIAPPIPRG
jgi:hypothetical protein